MRVASQLMDQLPHGELQYLRSRSLNRGIHAAALCEAAFAPVVVVIDLRQIAPATEGGFRITSSAGIGYCVFLPHGESGVTGLEVIDDVLTFLDAFFHASLELQSPLESSGEETVEGTKVYVFGNGASFLIIGIILVLRLIDRYAEDDGGGACMDISAVAVGLHHDGVAAIEGADAQLDLRKVEVQKATAFGSYDKLPDSDGVIAFSGHILKIGLAGGKTSGVRTHRHEVGMYATGGGIDPFGIPVDICALDL